MEDPESWIPELLKENWSVAIDELIADGTDIPYKEPAFAFGAGHPQSGQTIQGQTRCKIYRSGGLNSEPNTWGDRTRDRNVEWSIDVRHEGPRAREAVWSAEQIIDKILLRHRSNPNPDWHRITSWTSDQLESFSKFQRIVYRLRFATYSEPIRPSIQAVGQ